MSKESKTNRERFYFTHDYGARNDPKILELRAEYGLEGLGLYWCIVEALAEASDGYINPKLLGGLSVGFGITKAKLQEYIDFMIEVELLCEDDMGYYSKRMMEHKQIRKKLSETRTKSANKRWKKKANTEEEMQMHYTSNAKERKGKERKEKENKGNTNTNTVCVFNFKKSLLDYGFREELVDEWLAIRKTKKSINSEFSFNAFISQIEKTGAEKNEVLRIIAEKQWAGFNHAWLKTLNNNNTNIIENETDRRDRESTQRKQELYEDAKRAGMVGGEENRDLGEIW